MRPRRSAAAPVAVLLAAFVYHGTGAPATLPLTPTSPAPGDQAPPPPASAAISGLVLDGRTGEPVAGAVVSVSAAPAGSSHTQISDPRGRFVVRQLAPGSYAIDASAIGYFSGSYGGDGPFTAPRRVTLAEGQWFAEARVVLWPPGTLTGVVLDEQGEPVVGVDVRALLRDSFGGRVHLVAGPTVTTDDRGMYSLASLPAGGYLVQVPAGQPALRAGVPGLVYPTWYYPAARTAAEAVAVNVDFGDDLHGIDLTLRPVRAWRVAGAVERPPDTPGEVVLRLVPLGDEALSASVATVNPARDGRFTVPDVPAGLYLLEAAPAINEYRFFPTATLSLGTSNRPPQPGPFVPGRFAVVRMGPGGDISFATHTLPGAAPLWARTVVEVGDRDVTGVAVLLCKGVSLSGRLRFDPPEAPLTGTVLLRAEPYGGDPALGLPQALVASRDHEPFRLEGLLPGRYYLRASVVGPVRAMVRSVAWAGGDFADAPFETQDGLHIDDVVVTMTARAPRLAGVVVGADGPARGASVVCFAVEREQWEPVALTARRVAAVSADESGAYLVNSIPAGEYYVVAVPADQRVSWQRPEFLEAARRVATRVRLEWGGTTALDLRVQKVAVR